MSGPTKLTLPIAAGFGLEPGSGGSSGGRTESVTVDAGEAARRADSASKPEPKDPVEFAPTLVPEPVAPAAPAPQVTAPAASVYEGQDEIDALHARFDSMEAYIKRSLTIATLHARFDALETYLKSRFGE